MTENRMPLRPKQHVSEDTSMKIVKRGLPKEWILRSQQENDYGIDCEIELVMPNGEITGRFVKAQIKGRDAVSFDDKGHAYVGGIKQSTLRYWIEISKAAPVIAILTSNSEERVFFMPTFWQATRLLDGTDAEKKLYFWHELELTKKHGDSLFFTMFFNAPHEQIRAHKLLLIRLNSFLYEYLDIRNYDPWTINLNVPLFRELLENGRIFCEPLSNEQGEYFDYDHWKEVSEKNWNDSIMNAVASEAYQKVLALIFSQMTKFKTRVLDAATYWKEEDPNYYYLVRAGKIPESLEPDILYEWLLKNGVLDERFS
jgi:hypothetical protein